MIITSIPEFSLQYADELGLLRVAWAAGDDMRTFQSGAGLLLNLISELRVRHLVLDFNTLPDISVYDQLWLGANWMPGLMKLPVERVVLVINRRRVHNQLAIDSLIALSRPFIRFDIQFFPTVVSGLHWVSDYSGRMPALLAEWDAVHGPLPPPLPGSLAEPPVFYRPWPRC